MTASDRAAMSIIIIVPESLETVRKTMDHLRAQVGKARLELVFVAPSSQHVCVSGEDLPGFAGVSLVEVDTMRSAGQAKATGVQRANAALVAFAEDHSYPEPGWALALIEAYQGQVAAVGPELVNANPDSAVSWASMYADFGPTIEPVVGGQTERLPWHNSSYRRELLLAYSAELPFMLDVEGILHADLRRKGYALYLEPKARTHHLNISLVSSFFQEQFYGGRLFAASQAKYHNWSRWKRFLRIVSAPLVPWVRLRRALRDMVRSGRGRLFPRIAPLLILGLVFHASGEFFGYALGLGDALQQRFVLEFHRERHVKKREKANG